jgi:hypothetical protein
MIGEGIGEPRIGVRGAMIPSSLRLVLVPILGKRESKGARMDLTRDVRGTVYVNDLEVGWGNSLGVPRSSWPGMEEGVPGMVSASRSSYHIRERISFFCNADTGQTTRFLNSPCEGKTLSFALKLKNKNNGTNQTQIAKKAATSIKLGASSSPFVVVALAPYLYLGCLLAFAS